MDKKVAPAIARRKTRDLERVVKRSGAKAHQAEAASSWITAHAQEIAALPVDSTGEGLFRRDPITQREKNRQKEANRMAVNKVSGKQRRLAGFKIAAGGFVVEKDPPPEKTIQYVTPTADDAKMRERLQQLLDAATPFDPDFDAVGADRSYPTEALERKMRGRRGMAPTGTLAQVKAAYTAVFSRVPADDWQSALRGRVEYVLRYSLAGNKPPRGPRTGREILDALKRTLGEDYVPRALTSEHISQLLRKSTLAARGGGRGGKKSLRVALEELIADLGPTRR